MIRLNYRPFTYQKNYHVNQSRFRVIAGGRRVGKTKMAVHEAIKHCIEVPNALVFWVAPTYKLAKEVGWEEFLDNYDRLEPAILYKLDHALKVKFINGSTIYFKGSDNPDSLRGRGLTNLFIDEAAFCKPEVWHKILRPALSDKNGRVTLISTPNGFNWFKDIYDSEKWTTFYWPTIQNPLITKEELDDVKSQISLSDYEQEYEAKFITRAGRVYNDFSGEHIIPEFSPTFANYDIYLGLDFGYASHTAIVFMAVDRNSGNVIQFDEIYVSRMQMDDIIKTIDNKLWDHKLSRKDIKFCYSDPAGNAEELTAGISPVDMMRNEGFTVINTGSTIMYGLALVRSYLKNSLGIIRYRVTANCKETIRCFNGYQYDMTKDGNAKEEALKDNIHDHLMDALRYFFINKFDKAKYVAKTPGEFSYTSSTATKTMKLCSKCRRPFVSNTAKNEPPFACSTCLGD
jgi:phage terminase large subunit